MGRNRCFRVTRNELQEKKKVYELARSTEGDYRALNELSKQLHPTSTDITRRYIGLEETVVRNIFEDFG